MAKSYLKKMQNILDSKESSSLLHNRFVLYFIFTIALLDIFYLINLKDYTFSSIFVIIGFLTSFFSKNMIVILCIAMSITHILKFGTQGTLEGFEGDEGDEGDEKADTKQQSNTEKNDDKKITITDNSGNKTVSVIKDPGSTDVIAGSNPTQDARDAAKSGFATKNQGKDGVYVTDEDKNVNTVYAEEKLLENQKKLMKKLDKYRPLLDTMNNISKTLAIYKGSDQINEIA